MSDDEELVQRYQNLAERWTDRGDIEADRIRRARRDECRHDQGQLFFGQRTANGAIQVWKGCSICQVDLERRGFLPHGKVDMGEVQFLRDDIYRNPPCQVCGNFGTELHHWAPRELFGPEADHWPTGWLCGSCHHTWHERMNEAGARIRRSS